jgi:dienelactone hydrolase
LDDALLLADLQVPELANSLVIFAYEFGGSRNHPRTRHVARIMRENGFGTLLCDLLTDEEEFEDEATGIYRNNADLLAKRLLGVTKWVAANADTKRLEIAYFGACTGGGAVLIAAAKRPKNVKAVVSRGGRVDLAAKWLSKVRCPALLVIGAQDEEGIKQGEEAWSLLTCEKELFLVPGASHLFGEPGTLETMALQSARWLQGHLAKPDSYP